MTNTKTLIASALEALHAESDAMRTLTYRGQNSWTCMVEVATNVGKSGIEEIKEILGTETDKRHAAHKAGLKLALSEYKEAKTNPIFPVDSLKALICRIDETKTAINASLRGNDPACKRLRAYGSVLSSALDLSLSLYDEEDKAIPISTLQKQIKEAKPETATSTRKSDTPLVASPVAAVIAFKHDVTEADTLDKAQALIKALRATIANLQQENFRLTGQGQSIFAADTLEAVECYKERQEREEEAAVLSAKMSEGYKVMEAERIAYEAEHAAKRQSAKKQKRQAA